MHNSDRIREKSLRQKASRLAARGKNSLFFNLLFPGTLAGVFIVFYLVPLIIANILWAPVWLQIWLEWSPPFLVIFNCVLYSVLRARILAPYIKSLCEQENSGTGFEPSDLS